MLLGSQVLNTQQACCFWNVPCAVITSPRTLEVLAAAQAAPAVAPCCTRPPAASALSTAAWGLAWASEGAGCCRPASGRGLALPPPSEALLPGHLAWRLHKPWPYFKVKES